MRYLILILFIYSFAFSKEENTESKKNDSGKNKKNRSKSNSVGPDSPSGVSKNKRKPNQEINYNTFSQVYPSDQLQGSVNQKNETEIISAKKRDEILYQADLKSTTSSWDHLEKDILILRATNNTFPVFRKKYPLIAEDKLYQLYLVVHPSGN